MNNEQLYNKHVPAGKKVFLGEKGLTSTEASHKANMLGKMAERAKARVNALSAYTQTVYMDEKDVTTITGVKVDFLKLALEAGNYYQGSAWLREAVKAKDELIQSIKTLHISEFHDEAEDGAYRKVSLDYPVKEVIDNDAITEEDIIDTWTVADRAEYLSIEANVAALGKLLHKGGVLDKLRDDVLFFKPTEIKEYKKLGGMTAFVATNTLLYTDVEIDSQFMQLQEQHRTWESKLNGFKAKIKNDLSIKQQELIKVTARAQADENQRYNKLVKEFNAEVDEVDQHNKLINDLLQGKKLDLVKWCSKLKVVVPNALQPIFDLVNETK